ncbi:MAG: cyclopropane fatty acyl phospholipid synthase [Thermoleophilia bacterium]|nr:cyclopropane fatty acyl phospholipid synthase [Thermoleophilia bacterium]
MSSTARAGARPARRARPAGAQSAEALVRELFGLAGVRIGGSGPGDIVVHDPRFYARLVRHASLGLGESYMDAWWDSDAVDVLIEKLVRAGLRERIRGGARLRLMAARAFLLNLQSPARARRAVAAHYDIGNDLYTRMLDPRMVYTCAYWRDADTLAAAQEAKLELVCRKLGLEPGMRVLDLGCGWGGFAAWAAERHGCSVVGVTLSREQHELGRRMWGHLDVDLRLADYRAVRGTFDRVVSIGMMEHVGPRNHRTMMEVVRRSLGPEGVALVHTIASNVTRRHTTPFVQRYVFPDAVSPSLAQIGRAVDGLLVLEDLQNIGPDYDRTLMAWWENVEAARGDLPARYDERFLRMWRFYLQGAAGMARARDGQLFQMVLTIPGRAQPPCRVS